MGNVTQLLPATPDGINEEAKALVERLTALGGDPMSEYERKIVGNIKKADYCNRTGLIFLRALAGEYLKDEED